ncbi:MAG: UbiA-like polyprenyltransferase [Bacillota bacterium]|nr:UbiA-like polyprenyltransferase [Bacillota bacterium]
MSETHYQYVPPEVAQDRSLIGRIRLFLKMIDFHESVFSLPFALSAAILAAAWRGRGVTLRELFWVVVAMVAARSIALATNRVVDVEYDRRNPRTARAIFPRGLLAAGEVWAFVAFFGAVFLFAAWQFNPLCFWLSPLALAWITVYSYAKRFTWLVHLWLGLSLGLAPVAAWLALAGRLTWPPVFLGLAVTFWVTGFDIIFALQDRDADAQEGLYSIPVRFGIGGALRLSAASHLLAVAFFVASGLAAGLSWPYWVGVAAIGVLLLVEHAMVSEDDLSRLHSAYFRVNGLVSTVFFLVTWAALRLR